jgi:hypothetical protein
VSGNDSTILHLAYIWNKEKHSIIKIGALPCPFDVRQFATLYICMTMAVMVTLFLFEQSSLTSFVTLIFYSDLFVERLYFLRRWSIPYQRTIYIENDITFIVCSSKIIIYYRYNVTKKVLINVSITTNIFRQTLSRKTRCI